MQATLNPAKALELLEHGTVADMMALPDEVVRHGDNVYFELAWEDQTVLPEVVALHLEPRLRAAGCVPADGQVCMVVADPDHLRVWVNYREQTPEFGMIASIIGGLGLIGSGAAFFLFREQTERFLGANTGLILGIVAVISVIVLGAGIFMAMPNPGGRARLPRPT